MHGQKVGLIIETIQSVLPGCTISVSPLNPGDYFVRWRGREFTMAMNDYFAYSASEMVANVKKRCHQFQNENTPFSYGDLPRTHLEKQS